MKIKKISTCVTTHIFVAQYENIEFTKYIEAEIDDNDDVDAANKTLNDLSASYIKDLISRFPDELSLDEKKAVQTKMFTERASKKIPEFLLTGQIPNIAAKYDGATEQNLKTLTKNERKIKKQEDTEKEVASLLSTDDSLTQDVEVKKEKSSSIDDMFDSVVEDSVEEVTSEDSVEEVVVQKPTAQPSKAKSALDEIDELFK